MHEKRSVALRHRVVSTPLNKMTLVAGPRGLMHVSFTAKETANLLTSRRLSHESLSDSDTDSEAVPAEGFLDQSESQLSEYFDGKRRFFSLILDLRPVDSSLGFPWFSPKTTYYPEVQVALQHVPYGETASYGELAELTGHPGAARAVGSACAANPLPIVLPCHRIIRADGKLGQYGGGTELKRQLLLLEGIKLSA